MGEWVQIIHPDLGPDQIAEVHRSSLSQHYAAGWRLLAGDEAPQPEEEPEPPPMSKAQAAKAAKQAEQAAQAENKEK
jgi:hypothetical protein